MVKCSQTFDVNGTDELNKLRDSTVVWLNSSLPNDVSDIQPAEMDVNHERQSIEESSKPED